MTNKDEIAELKARVAELERAAKPAKPFVPQPYERYDPTAGMSMPRSALAEMARAVPDDVIRGIALRDNRAPTGRPGMIPSSTQATGGRARRRTYRAAGQGGRMRFRSARRCISVTSMHNSMRRTLRIAMSAWSKRRGARRC
jgi:hypothetical protein